VNPRGAICLGIVRGELVWLLHSTSMTKGKTEAPVGGASDTGEKKKKREQPVQDEV